jgi:hypothetical protein
MFGRARLLWDFSLIGPYLSPDDGGGNTGTTPAPQTTPAPGTTPAPTTTDATTHPPDVQRAIDAAAAAARREGEKAGRTAAETEAKRKADEDAAKAKGGWEKLATDRQAEIERLNGELAKQTRTALVSRIAAKHKLPDELASRLTGDDEAALDADAASLAKLVGPPKAPNTETTRKTTTETKPTKQTQDGKVPTYSFVPHGAVAVPPE